MPRLEKNSTDPRHFEPGLSIKQADPSQETSPATAAGRYIHKRFHTNPVIADLIAALAGLGADRRAAR
jgi:hypothetical protein